MITGLFIGFLLGIISTLGFAFVTGRRQRKQSVLSQLHLEMQDELSGIPEDFSPEVQAIIRKAQGKPDFANLNTSVEPEF
jgi:hypothetical protein